MAANQHGTRMLHIITHRNWMAEHLGATQHLGFDPVDSTTWVPGRDGLWAPGHHISLMADTGNNWQFQDALWWCLPNELLGRPVTHGPLPQALAAVPDDGAFVKLARHKYDYFTAGHRSPEEFTRDVDARPWGHLHEFVVSGHLDITDEYRLWVSNGGVLFGCAYRHGDWTWGDEDCREVPAPAGATSIAQEVASGIPGTYCVDVAHCRDGSWAVIETNPAWCSGFYAAPREVLETAIVNSQGHDVHDPFIPDPAVQEILRRRRNAGYA